MQTFFSLVRKYISWLKTSEGVAITDKILLFFIKISYISLRFSFLVLGRKRRNNLFEERGLNFGTLWNKFYRFRKIDKINSKLLKFKMPKYNYQFYCRNNKDDFQIMTFHEDDILEHKFNPKEGDIVIDVGAHIGPYTLKASSLVGINGRVLAIEADPSNYDILNRNINLNKITNVTAVNYAAYSKEEKIKLYLPNKEEEEKELSHTKYNTIMQDRAHNETKFVEVQANTLDYLLQSNGIKHEKVNWIKIDVEGAEFEVLKGAKDILSKSYNTSLLIEIHNLSAANTNLYEPIKEFLNSYNYKIDFEKIAKNGEKHIIAKKISVSEN
jgi:FkbM family methyltransferase